VQKYITRGALIAALYVILTIVPPFSPLSYTPIQVRVSEALTALPILTPVAVPALFVGCLIANILGPGGAYDIILGPLFTLIAAYGTYKLRKNTFFALACPVAVNALGVSLYLPFIFAPPLVFGLSPYWACVVTIGVGEVIAVFVLGYPLLRVLRSVGKERDLW
jgi:uncharacterized membrane protein